MMNADLSAVLAVSSETKLRELLLAGTKLLEEAGVPDASYDSWSLFSYVSGMDRSRYFMHQMDKAADQVWISDYETLLKKRANRIPLQQILGSAAFMAYDFFVNEHVLTPRQDTETLVETAFRLLEGMGGHGPVRILDMCTGSGCIAISLYCMASEKQIPVDIIGADLSEEALKVATINNERLTGGSVQMVRSDLFSALKGERFDLIVSNPPYIPSDVCETLMPEVKDHEPRMALDGSTDGLHFYRILTEEGSKKLTPGGYLAVEIGYDQGKAVSSLMKSSGFKNVNIIKDLAGLDRVVLGRMPDGR